MSETLIVIVGPTGIGKSKTAIELAEHFDTEIISSDSRQFYRELSIGTAVPDAADLKRITHHFIQHISIEEYYSASIFEEEALALIGDLFRDHSNIIMAGGSGLYIDAVCGTIDEIPDISTEVRHTYIKRLEKEGLESLRTELKFVDPEYYNSTDLKNPKRILRALEIYGSTGKAYSTFLKKGGKQRDFTIKKIGLHCERDLLYKKINSRVDTMMEAGLEDEARSVYKYRNLNALNTVGYKELFSYFDGHTTREEAIDLIKRNSRRYAKRQLTWWARDKEIKWFEPNNLEGIIKDLSPL